MKRIKLYIGLVLITSLSLMGCSDDFLRDKHSYDKFDDSIFESEIQASWFIDHIYYQFYDSYRSPSHTLLGAYNDERSNMTEEFGGTVPNWIDPNKEFDKANDSQGYYGNPLSAKKENNPYTRIRFCNILIEKIEEKGKGNLSNEFIKNAKGQALYFRALQYFELVRVYGGVPIVLEVQNAAPNDPSIQIKRSTTKACYEQIVTDLDLAKELLQDAVWKPEKDYGRITSASAAALKSRVLLTAASPLFNTDWDNDNNESWNKALASSLEAEAELEGMGYGLYGSNAQDWDKMFTGYDNKFNPEVINIRLLSYENTSAKNNSWERRIRLKSQTGAGGIPAPKELVDIFPLADGSRPSSENYDGEKFFLNRDPRFYRTFAFNGSKWGLKGDEDNTVWTYKYKSGNAIKFADNNDIKSPVFVRKMSNINAEKDGLDLSGTDILEYRYAELILNIAECYAATNQLDKSLDYLKKIRQRVGIPSANNYGLGTFSNKYEAIEACLYERRIELAYEGKRFWDIQRWMLYNDNPSEGNTTCNKLNIAPINGTTRTGYYWEVKNANSDNKDPLIEERAKISIDPDASDFEEQLLKLAAFYDSFLKKSELDKPLDNDGKVQINIEFKQNYYIFGLKENVLTKNPWIEQTIGWKDALNGDGTFDYRK